MLSPLGPAEQLHGGSRLISANSFWIRLALEDAFMLPSVGPMCLRRIPGVITVGTPCMWLAGRGAEGHKMCSTLCTLCGPCDLFVATLYATRCTCSVVKHAPRYLSPCMNEQFNFRLATPECRECMGKCSCTTHGVTCIRRIVVVAAHCGKSMSQIV
jgi:hypothetical protein